MPKPISTPNTRTGAIINASSHLAQQESQLLDITSSTWLNYDQDKYASLQAYLKSLSGALAPYKLNCPADNIKAIILTPHAGIQYSGLAGLSTYLPLAKMSRKPSTIIIFSTWHAAEYSAYQAILPAFTKIKTPLGVLDVDTELRDKLLSQHPAQFLIDNPVSSLLSAEHSHIVQYPLIQHVFIESAAKTMPKVLPILIPAHPKSVLSSDIFNLLDRAGYFIACNTDISHVNGDFPTQISTYPDLVQHDSIISRYLFDSNRTGLDPSSTACGVGALKWMKGWLKHTNYKNVYGLKTKYPRLTMYYHSHVVKPGFDIQQIDKLLIQDRKTFNPAESTVGYIGMLITNTPHIYPALIMQMEYYLTDFERLYLKDLARFSIMSQLYYKTTLDDMARYVLWNPAWSVVKRGVFVTLYKYNNTTPSRKKELRGCIGVMAARVDTVANNVIKYARESAFNDSRFSPITKQEFQETDILNNSFIYEISLLADAAQIRLDTYLNEPVFRLGKDGLLLIQGDNQGFFLPSVATEFNMTKISMLRELCHKAGMSDPECYKRRGIKLYYMEGFNF